MQVRVSLGGITREDLPLPVVYYPSLYGTFLAFAPDEKTPPILCACADLPVRNLLRLKENLPRRSYSDHLRAVPLDSGHFPEVIAEASERDEGAGLRLVAFAPGLCHRCNLAVPSLRYCHEMYGGGFVQRYGWYVNQTRLRLGMGTPRIGSHAFLPDTCPLELQELACKADAAFTAYVATLPPDSMLRRASGESSRGDACVPPSSSTDAAPPEAGDRDLLHAAYRQVGRQLDHAVENLTREQFGVRKIGEAWVSETLLSAIVSRLLPHDGLLRHHRPAWLKGLELDIYLPERRIGIEFQGVQHFRAVKAWGGQEAFLELQRRDQLKADLCAKAGVTLVRFACTEPLTEAYVRELLHSHGMAADRIP